MDHGRKAAFPRWSDQTCGRIIAHGEHTRPCARVDQWDGLQIRWACPDVGSNPTAAFSLQGAAFCSGSFSNITNPTQTKRKPISWLSLASLSPTFCPRPPFGSLGSGACHDHQQCLCGRIYGGDERAQHLVHGHFPGVGIAVIRDVEINFVVGFRIVKIGGGWYVSHVGRNWGFKCSVASQKVKGCGFPIMAHGGYGDQIVAELRQRTE